MYTYKLPKQNLVIAKFKNYLFFADQHKDEILLIIGVFRTWYVHKFHFLIKKPIENFILLINTDFFFEFSALCEGKQFTVEKDVKVIT